MLNILRVASNCTSSFFLSFFQQNNNKLMLEEEAAFIAMYGKLRFFCASVWNSCMCNWSVELASSSHWLKIQLQQQLLYTKVQPQKRRIFQNFVWFEFTQILLFCTGICYVDFLRSTSGAIHCHPLDGQHCGTAIWDDGPMLPPSAPLCKPWLGIKPWSYA